MLQKWTRNSLQSSPISELTITTAISNKLRQDYFHTLYSDDDAMPTGCNMQLPISDWQRPWFYLARFRDIADTPPYYTQNLGTFPFHYTGNLGTHVITCEVTQLTRQSTSMIQTHRQHLHSNTTSCISARSGKNW